ncbi:MAG: pilus assembly protein TadG-related protein, partial [Acidimicrobiales bacterium]
MTRARRDRGAVLPLVALLMPMLVVVTAIAVDLGRQRSDRRLAQAGADVVALDMIRIVEGRTLDEILADPGTAVALSDSAARNGFTNAVGFVVNTLDPHISNLEWGVIPGDDED